ncbi:uncharacterized protein LOC110846624 isoform X2 [Folsomia candida]|nr:uncharacterized protein LOC110846624 isoform X2 [Folsomia candida]
MVFPMAIKATFLMSGILGLKFGIGRDKENEIDAKVPFNLTLENQTIQIPSSFFYNISTLTTTKPITTSNSSIRGTRHAKIFQLPGYGKTITYDFALHGKCGPGKCHLNDEMCVTWVKVKDGRTGHNNESPLLIHQCLKKNGDYHTKINPSGGGLCGNGEMHSILHEPQACLQDEPPCPLIWKYKCVAISDALDREIHSCRFKTCPPEESCVEVAECDEVLPCIPIATCK